MPYVLHLAGGLTIIALALRVDAFHNRNSRQDFSIERPPRSDDFFIEPLKIVAMCATLSMDSTFNIALRPGVDSPATGVPEAQKMFGTCKNSFSPPGFLAAAGDAAMPFTNWGQVVIIRVSFFGLSDSQLMSNSQHRQ